MLEFKEFLIKWFAGVYDRTMLSKKSWGRDYGHPQRSFYTIELIDKLETTILKDQKRSRPCFLSVNYYKGNVGRPGEPVALEKLFFDIDYPGNLDKAREETRRLVDSLLSYCKPLIVFSGSKGYHVYCYIGVPIEGSKYFLKSVLELLLDELKILELSLRSLDEKVIKDISRLSRIPYTFHDKTKKQVVPLDYDFSQISIESIDLRHYMANPIPSTIVKKVIEKSVTFKPVESGQKSRAERKRKITWLRLFEDNKLFNAIIFEGKTFGEQPEEIVKHIALYLRNIEKKNLDECMNFLVEWYKRTRVQGINLDRIIEIVNNYCS